MALGNVNVPGTSRLELKAALAAHNTDQASHADIRKILSGENLLDNWYFVDPINQQSKTEYASYRYGIDRWTLIGGTLSFESGQVVISSTPNTEASFRQPLPADLIRGKTVTLSLLTQESIDVWVQVAGATGGKHVIGTMHTITADVPATLEADVIVALFNCNVGAAGKFHPIAAKLELGSTQTLAHQDENGSWVLNDPPPNRALELLKCQRYQYVFGSNLAGSIDSLAGHANTTKTAIFSLQFPATLRALPTLNVVNGNWAWLVSSSRGNAWLNHNDVEISLFSAGPNSAQILVSFPTDMFTVGEPLALRTNGDTGSGSATKAYLGQLIFDANL